MAIAAAGALSTGVAPTVIVAPLATPVPAGMDPTAERALASITVPGLPVAAATDAATIMTPAPVAPEGTAEVAAAPVDAEALTSAEAGDATDETTTPAV